MPSPCPPRILRKGSEYVALVPIRRTSTVRLSAGDIVPANVKRYVLQNWFRRRWVGPVGHPWTAHMMKLKNIELTEASEAKELAVEPESSSPPAPPLEPEPPDSPKTETSEAPEVKDDSDSTAPNVPLEIEDGVTPDNSEAPQQTPVTPADKATTRRSPKKKK